MDIGTKKLSTHIVVDGDAVNAHKTFLSRVWWGGGFPWWLPIPASGVVQAPIDDAGNGGIRQVPGFIQEQILDAKLGEYVEYTLKRKLFMPISYHRGRVSFQELDGGKQTKVTWEVSYTPYPVIGFLFLMFTSTFDMFFLPQLKLACAKLLKGDKKN